MQTVFNTIPFRMTDGTGDSRAVGPTDSSPRPVCIHRTEYEISGGRTTGSPIAPRRTCSGSAVSIRPRRRS